MRDLRTASDSPQPFHIPTAEWIPGPPNPSLSDGALDLWRVDLQTEGRSVRELASILSGDERARARRFMLDDDERRFIVRRAALRLLLDRYHCGPSNSIRFSYGSRGKPTLGNPRADAEICFSISYRDDFALLAFCSGQDVGVDLERIRDFSFLDEVAATFMAAEELRTFRGKIFLSRMKYFYLCWTAKEAVLKMTGEGLITNPRELKIHPNHTGIISVTGCSSGSGNVLVRVFEPFPEFLAAVAAPTPRRRMNFFTFQQT